MSVFQILSPDFRQSLPDDDDEAAFIMVVERSLDYLEGRLKDVDENERSSWAIYEEAQYGVMNIIIEAASTYEIDRFSAMEVPLRGNFGSVDFSNFRNELDAYLTRTLLNAHKAARRSSVLLTPDLKNKIRDYIHAIRRQIDATDMDEGKRAALHEKLTEFEGELNGKRLKFWAITWITLQVLAVPGGLGASADLIAKLLQNITVQAAEAHTKEVESQSLPPLVPPKLLFSIPTPAPKREAFSDDLDDEIPF